MKILRATILIHYGTDRVSLWPDGPAPFPSEPEEAMVMKFETLSGTGVEYVKANFPEIEEIEVIDYKTEKTSAA